MWSFIILPLKITFIFILLLLIRGLLPRLKINDLIEFWWKYVLIYTLSIFILNVVLFYFAYIFLLG